MPESFDFRVEDSGPYRRREVAKLVWPLVTLLAAFLLVGIDYWQVRSARARDFELQNRLSNLEGRISSTTRIGDTTQRQEKLEKRVQDLEHCLQAAQQPATSPNQKLEKRVQDLENRLNKLGQPNCIGSTSQSPTATRN